MGLSVVAGQLVGRRLLERPTYGSTGACTDALRASSSSRSPNGGIRTSCRAPSCCAVSFARSRCRLADRWGLRCPDRRRRGRVGGLWCRRRGDPGKWGCLGRRSRCPFSGDRSGVCQNPGPGLHALAGFEQSSGARERRGELGETGSASLSGGVASGVSRPACAAGQGWAGGISTIGLGWGAARRRRAGAEAGCTSTAKSTSNKHGGLGDELGSDGRSRDPGCGRAQVRALGETPSSLGSWAGAWGGGGGGVVSRHWWWESVRMSVRVRPKRARLDLRKAPWTRKAWGRSRREGWGYAGG